MKKYTLAEILAEPTRNGLTKPKAIRGVGVPMIAMGEIFAHSRIADIEMDRVPVTDKELFASSIRTGDILFARQSLTLEGAGKCSVVTKVVEPTVFESHLIRVRVNPEKADPFYIYYYFNSFEGRNKVKSIVEQVAAAGIRGSDLVKLEISLPDISTQRIIANFLNKIDLAIEVNNAINKNLSDQIQAIYCNKFDPVTHTPSGCLSDICRYSSDRIPVSELTVSTYYSTENMQPNKEGAVNATNLPSIQQTTRCHKGDVLISNIRPYFKKIVYVTEECGCSTDVLCFTPKKSELTAFLFGTLYIDRFFEHMVTGSKGTKMPRGDKQQIMNYPVVIPSEESLKAYNNIIIPMLEQVSYNRAENIRLAALRDTLLPRLMSGEIDVSNLDI